MECDENRVLCSLSVFICICRSSIFTRVLQEWSAMAKRYKHLATRFRISRRKLGIVGGITATMIGCWVLYGTINIVFPSQGRLQNHNDVVVSLAQQSHRLPLAEQLVEGGDADTLVISYFPGDVSVGNAGAGEPQVPVSDYCEPAGREGILCFTLRRMPRSEKLMRFETLLKQSHGIH